MKFAALVFALMLVGTLAHADVIPGGSHPVDRCAKITNIGSYPDIYLIGEIVPVGNQAAQLSIIEQGTCLSKGYKFNTFNIFCVVFGWFISNAQDGHNFSPSYDWYRQFTHHHCMPGGQPFSMGKRQIVIVDYRAAFSETINPNACLGYIVMLAFSIRLAIIPFCAGRPVLQKEGFLVCLNKMKKTDQAAG